MSKNRDKITISRFCRQAAAGCALFFPVAAGILSCSVNDPVSATDMPNENAQIQGHIYDGSGEPATGVDVYLVKEAESGMHSDAAEDTVTTDGYGWYGFTDALPGTYQVLAVSGDSSSMMLKQGVVLEDTSDRVSADDTLQASASLDGSVPLVLQGNQQAYAVLLNTPFSVRLDANREFTFAHVPPDTYELAIMVRADSLASVALEWS